uniref:CBFD_NFYB_HMF domain-containing protein n=1 Tax=Steinernema glaseri TaxID=37863 RepID=A0A1I7YWS2_9BILA
MKTVSLQPPKAKNGSGPDGGPPGCPKSPSTQKKETRKKWIQIRDSLKLARIKIALSEAKFFDKVAVAAYDVFCKVSLSLHHLEFLLPQSDGSDCKEVPEHFVESLYTMFPSRSALLLHVFSVFLANVFVQTPNMESVAMLSLS